MFLSAAKSCFIVVKLVESCLNALKVIAVRHEATTT